MRTHSVLPPIVKVHLLYALAALMEHGPARQALAKLSGA